MNNSFQSYFEQYLTGTHHYSAQSLELIILGLLIVLAFEIWMLVDVLAYRKMSRSTRMWWVLGMFLIHPLVAMVYLFARNNYKRL
ncbi:MAG TPA: hypothetical protein VLG47_05405 [Candidatus Saccharimonadales bacterium]|nr:hypothetical protein [Candidatus Saccharimonadales bacterium]